MSKPDEQAGQSLNGSKSSVSAVHAAVNSLDPKLVLVRSARDERLNELDAWPSKTRNLAHQAPAGQPPVGAAMVLQFTTEGEGRSVAAAVAAA